jgi:hypothetical protein
MVLDKLESIFFVQAVYLKYFFFARYFSNTVEPGYNDIVLCDTSSIASDILWCQLIPHY